MVSPQSIGRQLRLLIVRPSALGDVSRTVPALVTLRASLPEAHIDWLVHESFVDVVAHHPALDGVVPFPRDRIGAMFRSPRLAREALSWARRLSRNRYDMAIDLQGLLRSGLFTWLTRAPRRIGFANAREFAHRAYNHRHAIDVSLHTVDRMLALLEAEGFTPRPDMRLYLGEGDRSWLDTYLNHHLGGGDAPFATLAPTARWRCKCWPIEHYVEVARRLLDSGRVGDRIVVLAGPGEREDVRPLLGQLGDRAIFASTSVGQMMALLSRTALLVCNDSGPLHIAVGFDRPIVTVFGLTDPALVGPYGRRETVVRAPRVDPAAIASYRRHRDDQSLIAQVSVEAVWKKVIEQFDGHHRSEADVTR